MKKTKTIDGQRIENTVAMIFIPAVVWW